LRVVVVVVPAHATPFAAFVAVNGALERAHGFGMGSLADPDGKCPDLDGV
jgi:hypothetical protein